MTVFSSRYFKFSSSPDSVEGHVHISDLPPSSLFLPIRHAEISCLGFVVQSDVTGRQISVGFSEIDAHRGYAIFESLENVSGNRRMYIYVHGLHYVPKYVSIQHETYAM